MLARVLASSSTTVAPASPTASLQTIDGGSGFTLDTTTTHFTGMQGSCSTGSGATQMLTLNQLMVDMLVFSDNAATRTLIDLLGGFDAMNATAGSTA